MGNRGLDTPYQRPGRGNLLELRSETGVDRLANQVADDLGRVRWRYQPTAQDLQAGPDTAGGVAAIQSPASEDTGLSFLDRVDRAVLGDDGVYHIGAGLVPQPVDIPPTQVTEENSANVGEGGLSRAAQATRDAVGTGAEVVGEVGQQLGGLAKRSLDMYRGFLLGPSGAQTGEAKPPVVQAAEQAVVEVERETVAVANDPNNALPAVVQRTGRDVTTVSEVLQQPDRPVSTETIKAISRLVARGNLSASDGIALTRQLQNPSRAKSWGSVHDGSRGILTFYNKQNPRERITIDTLAGMSPDILKRTKNAEGGWSSTHQTQANRVALKASTLLNIPQIEDITTSSYVVNPRLASIAEQVIMELAAEGGAPTDMEVFLGIQEVLNAGGQK